jgi:hypothetical protein
MRIVAFRLLPGVLALTLSALLIVADAPNRTIWAAGAIGVGFGLYVLAVKLFLRDVRPIQAILPPELACSTGTCADGQREKAIGWLTTGIVFGPLILMSSYIALVWWLLRCYESFADVISLWFSVAIGVVCISRLPLPLGCRWMLALLYVPVAVIALEFYSLCLGVCMSRSFFWP